MPNNAFIQEEEIEIDTTVVMRERQVRLTKIVEAIDNLSKNKDWKTLKELEFDGLLERLEKSLKSEAKKSKLDDSEIYRLQGQLVWASRYSDLYKLAETYKAELNNLKKKLNENATI